MLSKGAYCMKPFLKYNSNGTSPNFQISPYYCLTNLDKAVTSGKCIVYIESSQICVQVWSGQCLIWIDQIGIDANEKLRKSNL